MASRFPGSAFTASLNAVVAAVVFFERAHIQEKGGDMNRWNAVRIASMACVFALVGCAKSPESSVETFYRALGKGEITEAKQYVSVQVVSMLGEGKLNTALSSEAQRIQGCGGIKNIEVKLTGQGEIRSGTVLIQYLGNCPPRQQRTKLVKEDGKWKIGAEK